MTPPISVLARIRCARVTSCGSRGCIGRLARRGVCRRAHAVALRRSTKATLMKEITGSPFWFTPVLRIEYA